MSASADRSGAAVAPTSSGRLRRGLAIGAFAATVVALGVAVRLLLPEALPDVVWSHPGEPSCARCSGGVPRSEFRLGPHGPEWHPGSHWSTGGEGEMVLAPPLSPVHKLVLSVERRLGHFRIHGPLAVFVPTGRSETVDGHRWTEYRLARSGDRRE